MRLCRHAFYLPDDFYSRKTITKCPSCGEALDFSRDGSALPGDGSSGT